MQNIQLSQVIPLTQSFIIEHSSELYYYCGCFRMLVDSINIHRTQSDGSIDYTAQKTKDKLLVAQKELNINSKTFKNYVKIFPEVIIYNTEEEKKKYNWGSFIVTMPFEVWDEFHAAIQDLDIITKKGVTRLFIYIYYYAMRNFGIYSKPRFQMHQIINMSKDNVTKYSRILIERGLLIQENYIAHIFNYRYAVPQDLWTPECWREYNEKHKDEKQ